MCRIKMIKGGMGILLIVAMLVALVPAVIWVSPAMATAPTTSLTITKYAPDGTTILAQETINAATMEATLTVQGDGTTHYWTQGPTFEPTNLWDPNETVNLKDKGALKGTDVKDLCNLVGGASSGDQIKIIASDGYNETFHYANVYNPDARQGTMVICWYTKDAGDSTPKLYPSGAYVPNFTDGMQLAFFAQTTNAAGQHVFGHQDMHDCLPEDNWHYYWDGPTQYPSTNGLYLKWISQISIITSGVSEWELELSGDREYAMSQNEFENGVGCTAGGHGATYTDASGTWSGLPLWMLCGWVDDDVVHGAGSYNDALADAGYDVKVSASDGYSYTFDSATVKRNDNIIVANALNDLPLPEDKYPLRLVGSALTSGGQKVGQIAKIELLNLPTIETWNLALEGAINYTMTQAEFESGVNCTTNNHSATYTDTSGTWKGLPLWLLAGYVDDDTPHGAGAFNDALAAVGYQIKVIASDGYSYIFDSDFVARNNNVIVANTLDGAPLPADKYPLKIVGSALVSGGQKVAKITTIQLINFSANPVITATAGENGTISPSGPVTVNYGSSQTFTITPNTGYRVATLTVDGTAVPAATSYTFNNVVAGHTISASFALTQDWPLQIVGTSTVYLSKTDFETMATAHPSNIYTASGYSWKGVALWRLIALVDDGDPTTFNSSLTSSYGLKLTAADGYSKTITPSDYAASFVFSNSEDVFAANKIKLTDPGDWTDLPMTKPGDASKLWYPLMVTGSGITSGSMRVGALIKIELLTPEITATAGANGSISPSGTVSVNYGSSQTFTITPTTGYHVADVLVDGVSAGAVTSYTFNNVVADHTISASFAIDTFIIAASAGNNGSISPSGDVVVNYGGSQAFTITPNTLYRVADVLVDGVSVGAVTGYTFNNVVANHTISATFASLQDWPLQLVGASTVNLSKNDFETLAAAHPSNTYTASGYSWKGIAIWRLIALVDDGDPNTFNSSLTSTYGIKLTAADGYSKTITPSDYTASFAFIDSENVFVANKIMLTNPGDWVDLPMTKPGDSTKLWYPLMDTGSGITSGSMRVGALIKIELLTPEITATAGANGAISPSGTVSVNYGSSQTFTITPSTGYHVADVLVDGVSAGAVTSYTFNNVVADHTISASFAINAFTVTASVSGGNGTVSPSTQTVNYGANATINITPGTGYGIASIIDNGTPATIANPYVISGVTADHNVVVTFGLQVVLTTGWNTFSTPISLDPAHNTLGVILADASYDVVYRFNAQTKLWEIPGASDQLKPCDALYIHMTQLCTIKLVINPNLTYPPSKTLYAGWNLIGLANLTSMKANQALVSVEEVTGGLSGYTQVLSQAIGSQTGWVYVKGQPIADSGTSGWMQPYFAYWVFMVNNGTLAGFTITP